VEGKASVTRGNAYAGACEVKSGHDEKRISFRKNHAEAKKALDELGI
jgi:hypothetical protein